MFNLSPIPCDDGWRKGEGPQRCRIAISDPGQEVGLHFEYGADTDADSVYLDPLSAARLGDRLLSAAQEMIGRNAAP